MFKLIISAFVFYGVLIPQSAVTPYTIAIAVFAGLFLATGLDELERAFYHFFTSEPDEDEKS